MFWSNIPEEVKMPGLRILGAFELSPQWRPKHLSKHLLQISRARDVGFQELVNDKNGHQTRLMSSIFSFQAYRL